MDMMPCKFCTAWITSIETPYLRTIDSYLKILNAWIFLKNIQKHFIFKIFNNFYGLSIKILVKR